MCQINSFTNLYFVRKNGAFSSMKMFKIKQNV